MPVLLCILAENIISEFIFLSQPENINQKVVRHLHAKSCLLSNVLMSFILISLFHTYTCLHAPPCHSPVLHLCIICNVLDVFCVSVCVSLWACEACSISDDVLCEFYLFLWNRRTEEFFVCIYFMISDCFVEITKLLFPHPQKHSFLLSLGLYIQ